MKARLQIMRKDFCPYCIPPDGTGYYWQCHQCKLERLVPTRSQVFAVVLLLSIWGLLLSL